MTRKKQKSEERKAIEQKARDAIAALTLRPLKCPWPFASRHDEDRVSKPQNRADVVTIPASNEVAS